MERARATRRISNAQQLDTETVTPSGDGSGDRPTSDASPPRNFIEILNEGSDREILTALRERFNSQAERYPLADKYLVLALMDDVMSIGTWFSDRIYRALSTGKDVLLVLSSPGGSIEPAFQISRLCAAAAKNKFVVAIPRRAKSAATLIALGGHEIHMGPLGELGPIDPQVQNLPALAISQALRTAATLATEFPRSGDMIAAYLGRVLTVEQIGYCERISEAATQYATRLLSNKTMSDEKAAEIARQLVYEYKAHDFVIDGDEAKTLLGDWVIKDSDEIKFAEAIYDEFNIANLFLSFKDRHLDFVGSFEGDPLIIQGT